MSKCKICDQRRHVSARWFSAHAMPHYWRWLFSHTPYGRRWAMLRRNRENEEMLKKKVARKGARRIRRMPCKSDIFKWV